MPEMDTKYFGRLTYTDEDCLEFPNGLPAFEQERRFLPIERPDMPSLAFLQSAREPSLCFLAVPVEAIDSSYEIAASADDLASIGLPAGEQPRIGVEAAVWVLLSVYENGSATANLLAPVIINLSNRHAVQAVRSDSRYSHRHVLASARVPVSPQQAAC